MWNRELKKIMWTNKEYEITHSSITVVRIGGLMLCTILILQSVAIWIEGQRVVGQMKGVAFTVSRPWC